ncbi:hypothetical protein [Myxococcus virescens]|uniref:Uncharacterized protein n=1 Tax=Myxococcus virescens TaxID=83456 RepID=A0A511HP78_9BACT|nr:hypothetical protein [Myxococcus virescens]GEL75390.1 hypothetical protein MVI01_71740 [Myxococcus virescens]SDE65777.1 hypothetical protein SAMN04488504_109304 [Myxococcus virescens]
MSSPRCPQQGKPSANQHRLGPYLLGPRLLTKPEVGRIYIARHQHTGRPALVLWPDPACDDAQPLCPLELRIVTSPGGPGERPFLAVEVARPVGDQASEEEVAEELRDALTDAGTLAAAALSNELLPSLLMPPSRTWRLRRIGHWVRRLAKRTGRLARRHWPLAVAVLAGAALVALVLALLPHLRPLHR